MIPRQKTNALIKFLTKAKKKPILKEILGFFSKINSSEKFDSISCWSLRPPNFMENFRILWDAFEKNWLITDLLISGMFSGFFCPDRKVDWNIRTPLITCKRTQNTATWMLLTYYQPVKNNFKVHKMIANNKKTLNVGFFCSNLVWHPYHTWPPFCLRTPLDILTYWLTDTLNNWHTNRGSFVGTFVPKGRGPKCFSILFVLI